MGMACQCPQCGMTFIIPSIQQPAAAVPEWTAEDYAAQAAAEQPAAEPEKPVLHELLDELHLGKPADINALADFEPSLYHIACPNGHELEAPPDMIDQEVLCPYCSVQFRLRIENSAEYRQRLDMLDRERARFWFNWAIAAAVLVGLGLIVMVIMVVRS